MRLDLLIQATQQAHYDGPCSPLAQLLSPRLQKPGVGVSINVSISSLEKQKTTPIPNCVVGGVSILWNPVSIEGIVSFFSKNDHVLGVSILWNPVSIQAKTDKGDNFKKK